MKSIVDEEINKNQLKCKFNCICQTDEWKPCGKILRSINHQFLEFEGKPKMNKYCGYLTSFGYIYYCACPVRVRMFEKYGI